MGLYDINQQRLIDNGGSVFIGDRLFIEIKYRTGQTRGFHLESFVQRSNRMFSGSEFGSASDYCGKLFDCLERLGQRSQIGESSSPFQSLSIDRFTSFHSVPTDRSRSCEKFHLSNQQIRHDIGRLPSLFHRHLLWKNRELSRSKTLFATTILSVISGSFQRLCPEIRRAPVSQRVPTTLVNASLPSTVDSGPFDYVDEEGASVIALRRRKRRADEHDDDRQAKQKLARLISDLTWSMDQPSSINHAEPMPEVNVGHYEVRQIQQQFTIETPLPQPVHKHKTAYGSLFLFSLSYRIDDRFRLEALYGRTSLGSQGAVERSTVIAAISIIFIIGISISLFVVYRTSYIEYAQRIYGSTSFAGFGGPGESIYGGVRGTSQACRYDMGRRSEQRFDESFFVSNVEPLGAYRRQY